MKLPISLLALGLAASVQALAAEAPKQVNLFIWGEYLAPDTLSSFEQKTGIKVVVDHFDSLETVETKLLTGRSGYDLVLTAGQHLQRAIKSGALQPLDKTALPHFAGLDREFTGIWPRSTLATATRGCMSGAPQGLVISNRPSTSVWPMRLPTAGLCCLILRWWRNLPTAA